MKSIYVTLLVILSQASLAQNPVKWTFSSKKLDDKSYQVTMSAAVQAPWHIYSQKTPDGGPLPTSISFNKNPLLELDGKPKESGKIITKHEEVFGVDVIYFDGIASFVQKVKLKGKVKTTLNGTIEFMACNDEQCLPPTEVPFNIKLE